MPPAATNAPGVRALASTPRARALASTPGYRMPARMAESGGNVTPDRV